MLHKIQSLCIIGISFVITHYLSTHKPIIHKYANKNTRMLILLVYFLIIFDNLYIVCSLNYSFCICVNIVVYVNFSSVGATTGFLFFVYIPNCL